ncbi:pentapeptide repeat-containing protein [Bacillus cereus]|nr:MULTISPECIES: pentapeptide repeat-containing protein [Bacillus cereus group]MCU7754170.1 pentapeptide repeat-containing protein [Bacillus cereus]MDA2624262.1 pentapeptide repeat-containing protein [Bacillus cereus]MDC7749379.1 pentapeptide repeat-containing protein [Bacillus cereus]UXP12352.1 pentapeptide repeat-containing protein [Bacillus cereus]
MSEVNARSADLTDANFTGAKLDEVVWKGAKVEGSKFEESVQKQI